MSPSDSAAGMTASGARIAITLGDPRGIGPEVVMTALAHPSVKPIGRFLIIGPESSELARTFPFESIGRWPGSAGSEEEAGRLSGLAIERAIELGRAGAVDALVTAPVSKRALAAAGYRVPGHTEWLRDGFGVPEVTMMMTAEHTPFGGPLRMALLTAHIPLRDIPRRLTLELVLQRTRIAIRSLRQWWGIARPRIVFAGVNPHASEGGLFGDEESRVLQPAVETLRREGESRILGIFPADTVFRRCLSGEADAVIVPYHDVGLAVLKTIAADSGVNVTAGLPIPRTSPDHGTAFDIAGRGIADPSSMIEAIRLAARFCRAGSEVRV